MANILLSLTSAEVNGQTHAVSTTDAVHFYCAMHFSAKRGIEIACRPSVCDVGGSGSHRSEILETNCTDT